MIGTCCSRAESETASFLLGTARGRRKQPLHASSIHSRNAGGQINHEPVSADDIVSARHDNIAQKGDCILFHIEGCAVAGGVLILLHNGYAALSLDALDLTLRPWPLIGGLGAVIARLLLIINLQHLATHFGVTLKHLDVTAEGGELVLLAHFKGGCLDLHRLIAVLRKALQG